MMNEFILMSVFQNSIKTYARIINDMDNSGHFILQIKYLDTDNNQLGDIKEYTVENIIMLHSYVEKLFAPLEDAWKIIMDKKA